MLVISPIVEEDSPANYTGNSTDTKLYCQTSSPSFERELDEHVEGSYAPLVCRCAGI